MNVPIFKDLSQLHQWLFENKVKLMNTKKAAIKLADAVSCPMHFLEERDSNSQWKSEMVPADAKKITVVSVINTTKLYDSHGDVHIDGLWSKSLKENKDNYLVKQHDFSFDGIITDNVKASAVDMSWKDLGFDYAGKTQALIYTSDIDAEDKTGMFDRYKAGKVKQHSVGMRYVKLQLAMDNKRYPEEQKAWKDYYDMIANKGDVDKNGYFWAVTEAKNIEGSAVVKGSNFATPTHSVSETKIEPEESTRKPLFALNLEGTKVENKLFKLNF